MRLFRFFRRKPPVAVTYRLIWFELHVAPFDYRFALIPEQPILIGGLPGEDGKGVTLLIRYDHAPAVFDRTVEGIDGLLRQHGIAQLPQFNAGLAFTQHAISQPGVHLRFRYADDRRWAAAYAPAEVPPAVTALLDETKTLARQIMREMSHEAISGQKAHEHLEPARNQTQQQAPKIIVRVKVSASGQILVNRTAVSLTQLGAILDDLKAKGGAVWYHREAPTAEPSPAVVEIIKQVLDAIMARQLPIQLQEQEY